jgi:peptidoglycan/LPS O-acetylase OafA/YrhL
MTQNDKKWYKTQTWIGVIFIFGIFLLAAGLYGLLTGGPASPDGYANFAVSMGFIMVLLAGARLRKGESFHMQDERTKKIGAYGLSYSWFLTFLTLFGVFWLDYAGVPLPDAGTLAVGFILLMGLSAKAFQSWLFRKGDVE